jgi:hypothetical protein
VATLDPSATPTYGYVKLHSGFLTDPAKYPITAGGPVSLAAALPRLGCTGWVASAPDLGFQWVGGGGLLRFYFIPDRREAGESDTVLLIYSPSGTWHCADDSYDTLHPTIDFNPSQDGFYMIWAGTYHQGLFVPGKLHVTEVATNHP